jgi:predicted TIM-barrel fold metal-dependent hydrolase
MLAVDCATTFGARPDRPVRGAPEALVARLAAGGVRGALTTSRRGVLYDHRQGNEETLRVCRRHPQLIPAATVNLTRYLDWEADVDWCLAQGFRAFRLFPEEQGWSVAGLPFRRLCEHLAPERCPLFLAHPSGERDALELAACTADLEVPVVLLHGSYANEATSIHLLQRYPNLHLDVARRATPHAVRSLADACGVARVLFGSDAPEQCVQPALNAVFAADLPAEETEQILSGNLLRLLGATPPALSSSGVPPLADEPRFRGYPGPTIDVHAHLGPWRFPIRTHTTETVLAYARRYRLE